MIRKRAQLRLLLLVIFVVVVCVAGSFGAHAVGGGVWWLGEIVVVGMALAAIGWAAYAVQAPRTDKEVERAWSWLTLRQQGSGSVWGTDIDEIGHMRWWFLWLINRHEKAGRKAMKAPATDA